MNDLSNTLQAFRKRRDAPPREGEGAFVPNFDLIARPYRVMEYLTLGSLLQETRTHFLPRLGDCRQALLLGDGDGRFLARLLASNPFVSADAVDTSAEMLVQLRRRTSPLVSSEACVDGVLASSVGKRRLRTHRQDALQYLPDHSPDLIVAHFFFDCFTQAQLEQLVQRLVPTMTPKALWLVSDFRIPSGRLRVLGAMYVRALYFAFRVLTGLRITRLPDHASAFQKVGFERVDCHRRLFGMLTTELWRAGG